VSVAIVLRDRGRCLHTSCRRTRRASLRRGRDHLTRSPRSRVDAKSGRTAYSPAAPCRSSSAWRTWEEDDKGRR
jgi:hypothetical protein